MLQQMLTALIHTVGVALLPVAALALITSGIFVAVGWRRRNELLQRQGQPRAADRFEPGRTSFTGGVLDVASEAGAVLRQFENIAALKLVRLELAVQPHLAVRADLRAFREILRDMVAQAIDHAPCGRILLGARRAGGRVHITVSDDGTADQTVRMSHLRTAERLAALQGATMRVVSRAGSGTTVIVRLLGDGMRPTDAGQVDVTDPADVWAKTNSPQRMGSTAQ